MKKRGGRDLILMGACVLIFLGVALLAHAVMPIPEGMIA